MILKLAIWQVRVALILETRLPTQIPHLVITQLSSTCALHGSNCNSIIQTTYLIAEVTLVMAISTTLCSLMLLRNSGLLVTSRIFFKTSSRSPTTCSSSSENSSPAWSHGRYGNQLNHLLLMLSQLQLDWFMISQ